MLFFRCYALWWADMLARVYVYANGKTRGGFGNWVVAYSEGDINGDTFAIYTPRSSALSSRILQ